MTYQPHTISFQQRNGLKVAGEIIESVGICLLIKVTGASRKNARGKVTLFPIGDMGDARSNSPVWRAELAKQGVAVLPA